MKKILMMLTHNRTDCMRLTIDMLNAAGALRAFDHVVMLLNGAPRSHRAAVEQVMRRHPDVPWDTMHGPGTRPAGLVGLQNRCVEKYPDALYVKVDDDIFVPRGWAERMFAAYERFKDRDNLALISPTIPNNSFGLHTLLTRFYPQALGEYRRRFGRDPTPERQSFTWHSPAVAEWATRLFLDINRANDEQRALVEISATSPYLEFSDGFSIGCIAYDYRHWRRMGGVPPRDEPEWCEWIANHGCFNVLDCSQIVLHYSFFVQQDWLDRSSLLEDIREINLHERRGFTGRYIPRATRMVRQIPSILKRRLFPTRD